MEFSKEENEIVEQAKKYARKNKKKFIDIFANVSEFKEDVLPVSVFMAGSPGAGKTEFAKWLIREVLKEKFEKSVIHIDADKVRDKMPGYYGGNSYLFQPAVSIIVEALLDSALKHKQSFVLDGTLSNYKKAKLNIERSLKKGRKVFVSYIYQNPIVAWEFTKRREEIEGRKIREDDFIYHFFESKKSVDELKEYFGKEIQVDVVIKNFKQEIVDIKFDIKNKIDNYIELKYTKNTLKEKIK